MLYIIDKKYYDILKLDKEFLQKESRPYFVVLKLNYRGESISVAAPLRSNLNPDVQKCSEEYLFTPSTKDTKNGNLAGFHLTKIIPFKGTFFSVAQKITPDTKIADDIAKRNIPLLVERCQKILNCFAAGEKIHGAIDFDAALTKLNLLKARAQPVAIASRRQLLTPEERAAKEPSDKSAQQSRASPSEPTVQPLSDKQLEVAEKYGFSGSAAQSVIKTQRENNSSKPSNPDNQSLPSKLSKSEQNTK